MRVLRVKGGILSGHFSVQNNVEEGLFYRMENTSIA